MWKECTSYMLQKKTEELFGGTSDLEQPIFDLKEGPCWKICV